MAGLSRFAAAIAVIPMIAFIGVLISWLMLDRNVLFARLALSASFLAISNSLICCRDIRKYLMYTRSIASTMTMHPPIAT